MVVEYTGRVGIGTTSPATELDVNGELTINDPPSIGSSGDNLCGDASGDTIISQNSGDTADCIVSSKRFKKDIVSSTFNMNNFMKYNITNFKYKSTNKSSTGPLAEDVEKINPEYVFYEDDNVTPHSIYEYGIFFDNVQATQEQEKIIQEIKAENDLMKASLCKLGEVDWC